MGGSWGGAVSSAGYSFWFPAVGQQLVQPVGIPAVGETLEDIGEVGQGRNAVLSRRSQ